jgi:hypothetical protein
MPAQITELYKSGEGVESLDNPSAVLLFVVTGTSDDVEVRSTIEAHVPGTYVGLPIQDYDFRPLGNGIWEVAVHYGLKKQTNQSSFSFDTGGGTAHVSNAISTVARYPSNAPDCQGAIGISGDSVEGVDITVPVYNFSETHYLPAASISGGYKATLFNLTGKVNSGSFKGFAAGEVLFLGSSGSQRGNEDWEISYKFAASPNKTGLSVGSLTGIAKGGWQHLWVLYSSAVDQNALIKRPIAAYVEQVYWPADFSLLGIGT